MMNYLRSLFCCVGLALVAGCVSGTPDGGVRDNFLGERERMEIPAGVADVYWKLTELNGNPAPHGSGGKEAHLLLQVTKPIARGFAGCNRFVGDYVLDGSALSFGELRRGDVVCAEGMPLEAEYLAALARVAAWSRDGETLSLSDAEGRVVARFMARAL
ncbi:MAG: META domain-containing protein [Kiritimatiellae bacterium]|nr:META domain-containing protein [Kiritimatiellia bacterium]